jgi:hypothetical protein
MEMKRSLLLTFGLLALLVPASSVSPAAASTPPPKTPVASVASGLGSTSNEDCANGLMWARGVVRDGVLKINVVSTHTSMFANVFVISQDGTPLAKLTSSKSRKVNGVQVISFKRSGMSYPDLALGVEVGWSDYLQCKIYATVSYL